MKNAVKILKGGNPIEHVPLLHIKFLQFVECIILHRARLTGDPDKGIIAKQDRHPDGHS